MNKKLLISIFCVTSLFQIWRLYSQFFEGQPVLPELDLEIRAQPDLKDDEKTIYHLKGTIITNFLRSGYQTDDPNFHNYAIARWQTLDTKFVTESGGIVQPHVLASSALRAAAQNPTGEIRINFSGLFLLVMQELLFSLLITLFVYEMIDRNHHDEEPEPIFKDVSKNFKTYKQIRNQPVNSKFIWAYFIFFVFLQGIFIFWGYRSFEPRFPNSGTGKGALYITREGEILHYTIRGVAITDHLPGSFMYSTPSLNGYAVTSHQGFQEEVDVPLGNVINVQDIASPHFQSAIRNRSTNLEIDKFRVSWLIVIVLLTSSCYSFFLTSNFHASQPDESTGNQN